jgi:ubiquinone/menaquinone biosynthesis C-methylase UbiE
VKRFLTILLLWAVAPAQVADKANETYKTKEGRDAIARSLADPQRNETEKPREIVDWMNLKPGTQVADVGTGVGFMLPFLSHAVGKTGIVYGEDIASDFLDRARLRAQTSNLTNIRFVLGTDRDPKLPADTLDAVLVLDTYHHFDYPGTMLGYIRDSLLAGGRLYIVDYYKREEAMPGGRALQHIRLDEDDVIREVEEHGFKLVSQHEHIPKSQYMAIFEKQ